MSRLGWRVACLVAASAAAVLLAPAAEAKRNVYASNVTADNVSAFDISASGALAPIAGSPYAAGSPTQSAFTPDGTRFYVADFGGGVSGYTVAASGSLTPVAGSPFPAGAGSYGVAVAPAGDHLYASNSNSNNVSAYEIAGNGSLNPIGGPVPAGSSPLGIVVAPDGEHLYVTNQLSDTVSGYSIAANGSLSSLGAPVPAGSGPFGAVVAPNGDHLYVTNGFGSTVSVYAVGANGTLTPQGPAVPTAPGSGPGGVALTPDGTRLYTANAGTDNLTVFSVDPGGALTPIGAPGGPAGDQPVGAAITPDGRRIYLAAFADNAVAGLTIAPDGSVSAIVGSPFASGPNTYQLSITPDQPPVASFVAGPATAEQPTGFNATASTDPDGTIARYDWDFGDGTVLADGGPTPTHTYGAVGTYQAKVTLTDNEGCSTTIVFTGQTASCNGSAVATQTKAVEVKDATLPQVTITTPADGAGYERNQTILAAYACADEGGGSGLNSCTGDVPDGQPFDTSKAGTHTFTVSATDNAGNTVQKTVSYQVNDPPPVVERLAVVPNSFTSDPDPTPLTRVRGTQIEVTLSEDAKVRFRVRHDPPRANGGPAPAPHVFRRQLNEGENSVSFTATLGKRTFAPGKYRLIARARDDADQPSERVTTSFRIKN